MNRGGRILAILAVIGIAFTDVFAIGGDYDYSYDVDPSRDPPGGLSSSEVPQFVVIGSDDNASEAGIKWLLDYMEGKKNPKSSSNNPLTFDSEQITVSFYSNSKYFNTGIHDQLKRAYDMGCEVSNHTKNHVYCLEPNASDPFNSKRLSKEEVKTEIDQCNDALLNSVGIPAKDIKGFRTPFL